MLNCGKGTLSRLPGLPGIKDYLGSIQAVRWPPLMAINREETQIMLINTPTILPHVPVMMIKTDKNDMNI